VIELSALAFVGQAVGFFMTGFAVAALTFWAVERMTREGGEDRGDCGPLPPKITRPPAPPWAGT
jgi:hypothetical protein